MSKNKALFKKDEGVAIVVVLLEGIRGWKRSVWDE